MKKLISVKEFESALFKVLPTFPETEFDKGKRDGIMQIALLLQKAPAIEKIIFEKVKESAQEFRTFDGIYVEGVDMITLSEILDEIVEADNA